jgi:hypothetical protein
MMTEERYRVYLYDELPRIGCGWRTVTAIMGRKWVKVRDGVGNKGRIGKTMWQQIKPTPLPPRKRKRKPRNESDKAEFDQPANAYMMACVRAARDEYGEEGCIEIDEREKGEQTA